MNVILEKLLLHDSLNDKDRYEIRQIFNIVTDDKKQNILNNFDKMLIAIIKIKEDLRQEQEIILWRAISNIETSIKKARSSWIRNATTCSIWDLKQIL